MSLQHPSSGACPPSLARLSLGTDGAALAARWAALLWTIRCLPLVPGRDARVRKLSDLFGAVQTGQKLRRLRRDAKPKQRALAAARRMAHPVVALCDERAVAARHFRHKYAARPGAMDTLERRHPREPHWYLQAIGNRSGVPGERLWGVLLRHRLALIDAAGMPAYLEASKESNVRSTPISASCSRGNQDRERPTLYRCGRAPGAELMARTHGSKLRRNERVIDSNTSYQILSWPPKSGPPRRNHSERTFSARTRAGWVAPSSGPMTIFLESIDRTEPLVLLTHWR